jgi:hypothetical protein
MKQTVMFIMLVAILTTNSINLVTLVTMSVAFAAHNIVNNAVFE